MEPFVDGFHDTAAGPVPRLSTRLELSAVCGAIKARCGLRSNYKITPGLYCVGSPGPDAPVLVTSNYKLTVDHLRARLGGVDAWVVVLDTHGVNVWCAAGKGLFGTEEAVARVRGCGLDQAAPHAPLIFPQMGATGVVGREVAKRTGRKVLFGPLRAGDVPRYLENDFQADEAMRRVTFTLRERAVLTPVEFLLLARPLVFVFLALFVLSGVAPGLFSLHAAWARGLAACGATVLACLAGGVAAPVLLPWLPGRAFSLKGAQTGAITGLVSALLWAGGFLSGAALVLWSAAVGSYLCMNFTGSTPFTSPSGVEKEMRRYLPWQIGAAALACALWIAAAFLEG
ncbi:hypothetical protein E8L03_02750 [Oceanidesulfovibrio marinus]|uniref:CO dehydrogenase/acetyl-CoA synthase delta subunit TIM barrel domain-containing protein n=1 Tax=Oceanidesulfovibrio marinus TaxID=370038 RepID=A0ABX6NDS7_9BACT|nr:hypothetical protein E8L03_02750 [Oceanidesulfovibrio marinus]